MNEELMTLQIQNIRLRAQNEELQHLVGRDFSVRGNGPWIHLKRIQEELEFCKDLDEFREWLDDVAKHLDEAMRV